MAGKSKKKSAKKNASKKSTKKKTTKKSSKKTAASGGKTTKKSTGKSKKSGAKSGTTRRKKTLQPVITLTHDQIAARAYAIYEANGRVSGRDAENWQEAQRQLSTERNA